MLLSTAKDIQEFIYGRIGRLFEVKNEAVIAQPAQNQDTSSQLS